MKNRDYTAFYEAVSAPFSGSARRVRFIQLGNFLIEILFYAIYPLLLLYILMKHPALLLKAVLVPAGHFILLSIVRKMTHRPRPYETWPIHALILKESTGNSMPSRHVFSSAVIAMMVFRFSPVIGLLLILVSISAAVIRIIGGVHYPSDTVAGFVWGIVAGWMFIIL